MTSKIISNGILRAVAVISGVVLLLLFLYKIQSVIAYLTIAAVITLIGRPLVFFLEKKLKFPNTLAVVLTILTMFGVLVGIISLFVPMLTEQGKNLSLLNINELQRSVNELYWEITHYFKAPPKVVNEMIKDSNIEKNVLDGLDLGFIPNFLNTFVSVLGNLSIGLFSVLFISFFFLKDRKLIQNGVLMFVPESREKAVLHSLEKINNLLSRYFVGLLLQLFVLFTIYSILLLVVGIKSAIVIAFLCALFNIIPYIGPTIGGVIMIVLTMTSNLGSDFSTVILPKAGYVLIGFILGQLIDNFLSQPIIFSSRVKSKPLEIFLVIIIAGLLFGVVGMIVAIPGYTSLKVILKEFFSDNKIVKNLTQNL